MNSFILLMVIISSQIQSDVVNIFEHRRMAILDQSKIQALEMLLLL